jgi:hypothetical protein
MKWTIAVLFLLSAVVVRAQKNVIPPDVSGKPYQTIKPTGTVHVPCRGLINPSAGDSIWKPILQKKETDADPGAPNEQLLDSLNSVYYNLKMQKRAHGTGSLKATGSYPSISKNFAGNTHNGTSPLDDNLAISNGGIIVSLANSTIIYYDTFGTQMYYSSLVNFIGDTATTAICDPTIVYDPDYDRFIFYCQQSNIQSGNNLVLCFSKDNNPMDGWWMYEMVGDPTTGTHLFDYPRIAINDSELFLSANLYDEPSGAFYQVAVHQFDKLAGYSGGVLNGVSYTSIPGAPWTIMPVSSGQGNDISTGMMLVCVNYSGADTIDYYRIYGNWCCSPYMTRQAVPTTAYLVPSSAPQYGTAVLLDAARHGCKALSGFYLNGIIHFVFSSSNPTTYDDEINYNRLSVATLTDTSCPYDYVGYDCAYPAIASYGASLTDASVMVGFGCSNTSTYPEISAVYCDSALLWSDPALVKGGSSYVDDGSGPPNRWGDYTGMTRYRASTSSPIVWMSGMFGDAATRWDTWIAEIGGNLTNGIKNVTQATNSKVYPNPTKGSFFVEFSLNNDCYLNISVVDNSGRTVKELFNGKASSGDNVFSFDKSNLSGGLYYLIIKSNSGIIKSEKIVVD